MGAPTARTVTRHPALRSLRCIRCGDHQPVDDHPRGCPSCLMYGTPANLACVYGEPDATDGVRLPYAGAPTLGEGGTPLLRFDSAGDLDLRLKWEGANPTGSHKDRFSALAVARALHAGYEVVAAASSGNAGVSLAAYCARAGLGCEIAVTDDTPGHVVGLMRDLGAEVVVFPEAEQRWRHLAGHLDSRTVLPVTNVVVPPVGSSPFGIEGYKMLAAEIRADLDGRLPDWVVVPASRGDLAWGVYLGFRELCGSGPVPRLCLVEPFPRVSAVLGGADPHGSFPGGTSVMPSLAGNSVALQALEAVRLSAGRAEVVDDAAATAGTRRVWRSGLPLEPSSAAAVVAVEQARAAGAMADGSLVVALATAHGLKGM
ncbi:pyridoxal-phosphate dependent enzyme [Streptomyces sp. KM273126]|uniref:threonine synthase n=1 Tax=Streptomyces sp. KM273126 TaxID=2545247 RepID=UPI0010408BD8|nr:pyridoxal-phosphate dependent enzyme [Streptomyces sp. KM273126]MBA2811361.1 pyridoxal-phosphate dependent enzyme [Streptomyces sp. KM273126]